MNEDELRAMVRAAIQKHLGPQPQNLDPPKPAGHLAGEGGPQLTISFGQYRLERAADDTMCLIEPAVRCNHCGFCKCHGH